MRLAVYWIPDATHPLWRAGCQWLGRDPEADLDGTPPAHARSPWRYGFHATLKAPLRLARASSADDFIEAVAALARTQPDFALPPLRVDWLGGFLALRPVVPPVDGSPLRQLADACVRELDRWRAPLPGSELKQRAEGLDAVQLALLHRWGYPHVFGRWRFHLSLSDPHPGDRDALQQRAEGHFAEALALPLRATEVAVFQEDAPNAPLRLVRRCPLLLQ